MTRDEEIKAEAQALANIGRSHDGQVLVEWLFRRVWDLPPAGVDDGALREHLGERRLARELYEKLTRDLDAGRTESHAESHAEPGARPRWRGARRPFPPADATGTA